MYNALVVRAVARRNSDRTLSLCACDSLSYYSNSPRSTDAGFRRSCILAIGKKDPLGTNVKSQHDVHYVRKGSISLCSIYTGDSNAGLQSTFQLRSFMDLKDYLMVGC